MNRIAAVSPATLLTPSIVLVAIPGAAVGRTVSLIALHFVAPSASAACLKDQVKEVDQKALKDETKRSTRHVIRKQFEVGIDVANNGEQPRVGFDTYVYNRVEGFGGKGVRNTFADLDDFPGYAQFFPPVKVRVLETPKAVSPLKYTRLDLAEEEVNNFKSLVKEEAVKFEEFFFTAASPGAISGILLNDYYPSHKDYVFALAKVMKGEYELIVKSGLILQLDCPDLGMERHMQFKKLSDDEFREIVRLHIDAINEATENIPRDKVRLHACWGNYGGPHHKDVPLEKIIDEIYNANVGAFQIELANPRHEHEYKVFKEHPLPKGTILIAGSIDVKTNIIEHPEVVSDRLIRVANAVGDPTRIMAGTDCGFGTFAGWRIVDRDVAWAKLESLSKGAKIASAELF